MTLRALENKFERYDMVICDEFGYVSCDKAGAEMLFNLSLIHICALTFCGQSYVEIRKSNGEIIKLLHTK